MRDLGAGRGDVVGVLALVLHLVVRDARALSDEDLDDRVGEVVLAAAAERRVGLDEVEPAVAFRDQQHAREGRRALHARRVQEEQLHRRLDRHARGDAQERTAGKERRVERGEGVAPLPRKSAEVLPQEFAVLAAKCRAEVFGDDLRGDGLQRGKLGVVDSVDEDETAAACLGRDEPFDGGALKLRPRAGRGLESLARDRRDVRILPVLVVGRREPQLLEARERPLAQTRDPRRLAAAPL